MEPRHLGMEDDGQVTDVEVGDLIIVTLAENATTGYRWHPGGGGGVLRVVSDGYAATPLPATPRPERTDDPVMGQGGMREFHVSAIAAGATTLTFALRRGQGDAPAIQRARYSVTVHRASHLDGSENRP